jgi:hypothetical protein
MPATTPSTSDLSAFIPNLMGWADSFGHALGQGIGRGLNVGLGSVGVAAPVGPRKRGRPAKPFFGVVPADQRCKVSGCSKPARSKGLCSAHYQAARRKKLGKA